MEINDVKVCRRKGHPVKRIICCASVESADLTIMSTHGRTWLSHLWLRNTAENIIGVYVTSIDRQAS
ncbi:MAG: universal stress protein [Desulfomonilaceae bacterium]